MPHMDKVNKGWGCEFNNSVRVIPRWGEFRGLDTQPQVCQNIFPLQMRKQGSVSSQPKGLTEL